MKLPDPIPGGQKKDTHFRPLLYLLSLAAENVECRCLVQAGARAFAGKSGGVRPSTLPTAPAPKSTLKGAQAGGLLVRERGGPFQRVIGIVGVASGGVTKTVCGKWDRRRHGPDCKHGGVAKTRAGGTH
jgi:hypothetical protein